MSGKYERAPLVYVTASIRTTGLPKLLHDQTALLEQLMIKHALPEKRISEQKSISVTIDPTNGPQNTASEVDTFQVIGYFSSDETESLIFKNDIIEYRTTRYEDYNTMCERLTTLFNAIFESIDVYKDVVSKEISMSYVDVILPYKGRQLSDYFNNSTMPSMLLGGVGKDDYQVVGNVSLSRIINPHHKVNISLEQLPIINGAIPKFLPNGLTEPESKFTMPLFINPNVEDVDQSEYALLLTQSMQLTSKKLSELDIKRDLEPLHKHIKSSFKELIRDEVCNKDWGYTESLN